MKRVSVITPLYYGQSYLDQLFGVMERNTSALQRQDPAAETELILVNDSPDMPVKLPTGERPFAVHLLDHGENRGIHAARVTGLAQAQGEFILFLDQDDVVEDDFFCRQLAAIGGADVVVCNAWLEQPDGSRVLLYRSAYAYKRITMLETYTVSHNQIVSPGQCLIRRSAIPGEWTRYITRRNGADDLLLWIIMLSEGKRFALCKEPLYTHKYTGVNLSAEEEKMDRSTLEIAGYLERIPAVRGRAVAQLRRSRGLSEAWRGAGPARKAGLILANAPQLAHRAWWKWRGK